MRCDEIARRLAKIYPDVIAIHPEVDAVLSNAIMILRSEAMAHHCTEDFSTEYVASVFWGDDDLRGALENENIDPTDGNLEKYFPNLYTVQKGIENCCIEAGNEAIATMLQNAINEEKNNGID